MDSRIKIILWNVRGLNNKFKRAAVFQYLKQVKPHVVLLQETHLEGSKFLSLRKPWIQRFFHSSYSSYARGASVLISKAIACTIHRVFTDPGGRYVALVLDLAYQKNITSECLLTTAF